jgi:hypothetical protein
VRETVGQTVMGDRGVVLNITRHSSCRAEVCCDGHESRDLELSPNRAEPKELKPLPIRVQEEVLEHH